MSRNYKTGLIITGDASGGIRAIKATDDELGKLNQGFDRGSRRSKQFNQDVNATSQGLAVLRRAAAPIAGIIAGMFAANTLQGQINWADQLQKTNLRIGASTEALSQYNYVASLSGVEFNQLTTAWQRQTRRIAEAAAGTGVAVAALEKLNLSAKELNQLKPEEQFERIAEAMQGVENSSERVRLAQQLWDSEGVKLVQIVNSGTEAIAAMRAEANALGLTIGQDAANAMATYNDEVDRLKFAAQGVSQTLLTELVPSLTESLQSANAFIQEVGGAEVVVDHLTDAVTVLAALMVGRYAAAFVSAAKGVAANTAATMAQAQADVAATAAARAKTAESLRLAVSEKAAAARAYENSRAIAAATGNTALRTRAINQMAVANQRAIGAETAHAAAVNANSAAMARGTVAAQGMAIAKRGLSSAMLLVGGPVGAAVLATGALGVLASRLDNTAERAANMEFRANELAESLQHMGETSIRTQLAAVTLEMAKLEGAQEALEVQSRRSSRTNSVLAADFRNLQETIEVTAAAQSTTSEESEKLKTQQMALEKALELVSGGARGAANEVNEFGGVTSTTAAASREAAKQTTTLANAYENLLDRIQPNRRAARQYAQDAGVLNLALATGRMNTVQYMQAMGMLQESFQAAQRETENLAETTERAALTMEGAWDEVRLNGLRRLDDGIASMWQNAIDGSLDAGEAMKRILNQTLAEMAHMAITRPIMVQMQGMMGMGGTGGAGGGMGGLNIGSLGNIGKTIGGWFGGGAAAGTAPVGYGAGFGAQAATGTYSGWAGSAAAGAGQSGGLLASVGGLGGAAGMAGMAYMGYQIGDAIGKKFAGDAKYGSNLGGLTGGIVPIVSKALFGGSWQTKDGGLNLGVAGGDITGNQYERQRKSGGLFSGSSYRTRTSELDSEFESALSEAYAAQEQSLAFTLDVLGQQSSALNAFSSGLTQISTKGKTDEEVEQAVEAWLQGIVNRAAQSVVDPADYAMAGETTVETLNRLATALTGVNPLLEQLHDFTYDASLSGGAAAAHLVELAGGLDALSARTQYYYDNILTETQRHEISMKRATQAMGAFTAQTGHIINSADQLYELVEGIDRNTEAGRALYVAALDLAPALVDVEKGLERVRDRFADMLRDAESALSSAEQQARSAYQAFENQAFGQQLALLELAGDSTAALALQRERELLSIDPLLHETQRVIWAIEDETQAKQDAIGAAKNYATSLAQVSDQLASTFNGISAWVDQQNATGGTPRSNLGEAQAQLDRQLELARSGDRNALQSITQYADRVLQANSDYNASGAAGQAIRDDVLAALEALPEQISPEEYIAEEIKQALREQTQGISSQLGDVLRGDNPSKIAGNLAGYFTTLAGGIDGVLTREQLAIVMSGKATDAELQAIMRAVDLNGDGVMDGLESVIIQSLPTDAVLGTVLRNKINELDKNQLTHAQIRTALSPIATDAEIDRLIREVDVNGDGIVTRQELTNKRVGGLAGGIAKSLNPAFDMLDGNLDGKLTFAELSKGLDGIATDKELRSIMRAVDLNGDGVISGLEGVIIAGMPTDSILGNVLRGKMNELDKNQLTHAQIRKALSPLASDAEISRLIREVDVNGDGIITRQELTNARVGGLAMGISGSLSSYFGSLEDGIGGVLTHDQLAKVMGGKATDAELRAISRAVDLSGDGVISGLESVIIAGMPTDSILGNVLRSKMNELDKNQLTHAQIRKALSPIASDAEIKRLIREVDVNGNGIITRQELTNARVSGLATGIAKSLSPAFEMLDGNLDGKLTFAELSRGLDGMATDEQLKAIARAVDLNADGVISGLESVVIAGMPTDSILAGVLTKESKRLGKEQLTQAEVRAALKGLATDGQINSLLNKTDVNGHRIWSRQGATNSRLAGLAKGIGSALSPMFSDIDTSLDGLIDYKEFSKAFSGMATDKELRNIFGKLDEDGSGTIDRLEALARTGEGTEDNTKSLEERAYDQLASLNGLVGEMSRTTDQFVGLNSNIVSLKDSINALGVAQADIARIERERKGAEIAAQAGMTLDRRNQQLGERGAVRGEIDRINDAYKGINMGQVKYRAQLDLKDGLDGWHTAKDGNKANWEGWESDFDRFVGTLRDANLGAMSQSEFDKWVAQREKQSKGMWSATHVETVAERVRSQEILRRHSIEMAQLDSLRERLENANSLISSFNDSIVQSRRDYKEATGKAAPFAKGGVFEMGRVATNSIVSSPTLFDMGLMGEADPEAIVPLSRGDGGRLGVDATGLMRIPDGPLELPMPDMPLPQFPALGSNDVLQVLQDVKRELQESRKENKRLQEENNRHAAAAVAVQQAGFNGQINEQKKGNAALGTMASKARLEGARR